MWRLLLLITARTICSISSSTGFGGNGVYTANITLDGEQIDSIDLDGNDVETTDTEKYILQTGRRKLTILPRVTRSGDTKKKYVTLHDESGEEFTAQVRDDNKAKFIFIDQPLDMKTVDIGPNDGVVLLEGGALTAGMNRGNRRRGTGRSWINRGFVTIGRQDDVDADINLFAADDGLFGVDDIPAVFWRNEGKVVVGGTATIGTPNGSTINKGGVDIRNGGSLFLPYGTRVVNSGQFNLSGGFFGDVLLDRGGTLNIYNRRSGYHERSDIIGSDLRGRPFDPPNQARNDLADGGPENNPPGADRFFDILDEATGGLWGKVIDRDGSTVLWDPEDQDTPDDFAREKGINVFNEDGLALTDLGFGDAVFVGPNQSVTINRSIESDIGDGAILDEPIQKMDSAFYSILGYTSYDPVEEYGETDPVDPSTSIVQDVGAETTVQYNNDNSWFNGVFRVKSGVAEFTASGAVPGGDIYIENGSSFIWHGGAKDKNNRPTIFLSDDSKLTFNLNVDSIFSVYGKIQSTPGAELHFEKGIIYIKNDCSGYQGDFFIEDGATFHIRTDGDHKGKMFGGRLKSNGNVTLLTNQGVSPLTLTSGTLTLMRDEADATVESFIVQDLSVGEDAVVNADLEDAFIDNLLLSGTLNASKNATFYNADIAGGTCKLMDGVNRLTFTGTTTWGSRLITTDNVIADVTFQALKIRDDHDMLWELDLDPQTNTADHMTVGEMFFTGDSSLVIDKFKLLSSPTAESHVFEVLSILNNGNYPNIRIDAKDEVTGTLGIYKLYAEGGPGCITLRIPDAAFRDATPIQLSTIQDSVVPLKSIHQSLINSAVGFHGYVFDESKVNLGKYRFWDKTYSGKVDTKLSDTKIDNTEYGTIFGCDFRSAKFDDDTYFMPTVFFNYSTGRSAYDEEGKSKKGRVEKYMFGVKGSLFAGNNIFEAIGSYGFIGSNLKELGIKKSKLHSNIFSVSAKISRYCGITNNAGLKPEFMVTGSYAVNGDYREESTTVKNKNTLKCTLSPGLFIVSEKKKIAWSVGARCNYEIGKEMKSEFSGDDVGETKLKRMYGEALCSVKCDFAKNLRMGLEFSHQFCGRHGIKSTISIAKEF
jgi:hypothetical protein